jgi:carnitine O-acetyltransferase
MYRDHFFSFPVAGDHGAPVSVDDITRNLEEIVASAPAVSDVAPPVGVLTTENRTKWALVRSQLMTNEVNRQTIETIESAVLVVCLDESRPITMEDEAPVFLHRDGRNRWMDKSIQLVVCANGRIGIPMEHSGYDGHTFLRMANEVHAEATGDGVHAAVTSFAPRQAPQHLRWQLSATAAKAIDVALANACAQIAEYDTFAFNFEDFGKKLVTKHNMSPDGFVQMAFQLAYLRQAGHFACTYESVMTKMARRAPCYLQSVVR